MLLVGFFFVFRVGCGPDRADGFDNDFQGETKDNLKGRSTGRSSMVLAEGLDTGLASESSSIPEGRPAAAPPAKRDVIVQLFNWPFSKIAEEIPLLAEIGYGQIHVSPPNLTIDNDMWWGRYQPVDYRLIDGPLGNETSFKNMIDTAHRYGIAILVDLVLNHTANEAFLPLNPSQQARQVVLEFGPLFTPEDYNPAACITDYNDLTQVRKNRLCGAPGDKGLPDLNQNSPRVLAKQKEFVAKLLGLGVDGFRLDAVKHMEPTYFHKLFTPEQREKYFFFGEIITEPKSYDRDLGPYLKETSFSYYDFPLRSTIQDAFRFGGNLSDLLAPNLVNSKKSLPWNRSVTFVMAHDIPNNDIFRTMILDPVDEVLAYGYLLGRSEGVPYVYSDLGTAGGAGLQDDRWAYAHRAPVLAKMIQFHNLVFGTVQKNLIATECLLVFSRTSSETKGIVTINKCGDSAEVTLDSIGSLATPFKELITGTTLGNAYQGSKLKLKIPGRSVRMYVKQ